MSRKRVSYQNLLKEAISEFDTSKTVDVKGPMLDPILKWDGQGELPIYKDAASILERYYFNEENDPGVEVAEMEYNEDGTEAKTSSEKDAVGAGTKQAGTSDKATISASKKDIEGDLAKEDVDVQTEKEFSDKDVPKAKEYTDEASTVTKQDEKDEKEEKDKKDEKEEVGDVSEDLENQVIEKLIAEMEEEEEKEEKEEEKEVAEMDMTYTGEGPKEEAPKEKKASGPEEDTKGAGTEQAGTGTAAGQIPDRKDNADKMVKPKNYNEQDEPLTPEEEEAEEELDVDKEVKEQAAASAVPGGPSPKKGEDAEEDVYEEAFQIFKEAIEDEGEEVE